MKSQKSYFCSHKHNKCHFVLLVAEYNSNLEGVVDSRQTAYHRDHSDIVQQSKV